MVRVYQRRMVETLAFIQELINHLEPMQNLLDSVNRGKSHRSLKVEVRVIMT